MPQLDPETFAPQLIWLAITFIGLYFFMVRMVLPKIGGVIEQRRDRIASDLDQAQALKEATDKAVAAYEGRMAEARANAQRIAQATRERFAAEAEAERARVDAELAAKIGEAEDRVSAAKAAALQEVRQVASDVAADIVVRLTGAKVSEGEAQVAVEEAAGR
jgi:F-type H+-transporting ATPase subunit b